MTSVNGGYVWSATRFGHDYPVTLDETLAAVEHQILSGDTSGYRPLSLGFTPLDEVLGGGLRAGDLMIVGGGYGVGKTIFALQVARNVVQRDPSAWALYICYEHEPAHLMSRLLCLETALAGLKMEALTLRRLDAMIYEENNVAGLEQRLRQTPRYAPVLNAMDSYAPRLLFVRASGVTGTVARIREWLQDVQSRGGSRVVVVIDYVQKIPIVGTGTEDEEERTIRVIQDLKEIALTSGARMLGTGLWQGGDRALIDGAVVNGSWKLVGWVSGVVRRLQSGYLYHYALVMILGLTGVIMAAAAVVLGAVHGDVGVPHQVGSGGAVLRAEGDAEGAAQPEPGARHGDRLGEDGQQPPGEGHGRLLVGAGGGDDGELVPTEPRDARVGGGDPLQPLRDDPQQLVTRLVAEGVVDRLEAVEVEQHHRDRRVS